MKAVLAVLPAAVLCLVSCGDQVTDGSSSPQTAPKAAAPSQDPPPPMTCRRRSIASDAMAYPTGPGHDEPADLAAGSVRAGETVQVVVSGGEGYAYVVRPDGRSSRMRVSVFETPTGWFSDGSETCSG